MRLVSGLMTWTDVSLIGRERRRARREIKSSRNGVHIANGVVREPVCFVAHLARAAGAAARRPRRRPTDTAGRRGRPNPVTPPARRGHRDRDRGLALITEGLVNYFSEADVRSMWQRFSSLMRQFPEARYWSDIALSDDMGGRVAPFVSVLSAFVRGRVHLHFRAPTDAEAALRECGFGSARAIDPGELAGALGDIPGVVSRRIRVIEATTAPVPVASASTTTGGESDVHNSN